VQSKKQPRAGNVADETEVLAATDSLREKNLVYTFHGSTSRTGEVQTRDAERVSSSSRRQLP
jgi:hypothetical protein